MAQSLMFVCSVVSEELKHMHRKNSTFIVWRSTFSQVLKNSEEFNYTCILSKRTVVLIPGLPSCSFVLQLYFFKYLRSPYCIISY